MKNLMREQNADNLQKNKINSKYLIKMSYVSLTIDLISFTTMEILKFIYNDDSLFHNDFLFFLGKVKTILNSNYIGFHYNQFVCNHVLFNYQTKN